MNAPWFFLSYARTDSTGHEHLKQFHLDLAKELRRIAGLSGDTPEFDIGFIDSAGIRSGEQWVEQISGALNSSRVLICLYSRGYFSSRFCGKEFEVFRRRVDAYRKSHPNTKIPPLIVPVLWDSPHRLPEPLPEAVSGIQYTNNEFGEMYESEGLYYIMKIDKYRSDYNQFLLKFAGQIFNEANPNRLQSLSKIESFEAIESAFHKRAPSALEATASRRAHGGPKVANFVYVVGQQTEFDGVRKEIECYGDEAPEWQPYYPPLDQAVGILSQEVTTSEGLLYATLPIAEDLLERLRDAEKKNTIVVLVVDPWSIQVATYQEHMLRFDEGAFINCGVLIPWNKEDKETMESLDLLQKCVKQTFTRKFILNNYFRGGISSAEELRKELCDTINQVRRRLLLKASVEQVIATAGAGIPSISNSGP